jgi:hypothetical protein
MDDDEWKGAKKNQVVLIGQNLDKETLLKQIENCLKIPSTNAVKDSVNNALVLSTEC